MSFDEVTVYKKRTTEVLDVTVDFRDECVRLGESGIVSATWAVDPLMPGDATLSDVPHQPRLDGFRAIARVAAGNTQDTLFLCTATFASGQVSVDKTLIKWIP